MENVEIQNRWKEYYEGILNMKNPNDPLQAAALLYSREPHITMGEVTTAIKKCETEKSRTIAITADVVKMIDRNAEWLWQVTTKTWSEKKSQKI